MKRLLELLIDTVIIAVLVFTGCSKEEAGEMEINPVQPGSTVVPADKETLATFAPDTGNVIEGEVIPEITPEPTEEPLTEEQMKILYQKRLDTMTQEDLKLELMRISGDKNYCRLSILDFYNGKISVDDLVSNLPDFETVDVNTINYYWTEGTIVIDGLKENRKYASYVGSVLGGEERFQNETKFNQTMLYVKNLNDRTLLEFYSEKRYPISSALMLDTMDRDFIYLCNYNSENRRFPGFYDRLFKEENGEIILDACGVIFLRDAKYQLDVILESPVLSMEERIVEIYSGIYLNDKYTTAEKINLIGNAISYFDNIDRNTTYRNMAINGMTLRGMAESLQVQTVEEIDALRAMDQAIIQAARAI